MMTYTRLKVREFMFLVEKINMMKYRTTCILLVGLLNVTKVRIKKLCILQKLRQKAHHHQPDILTELNLYIHIYTYIWGGMMI